MEMIITNPIMMQAASNRKKKEWTGLRFEALEDSTITYHKSFYTTAEYSTDLNTWADADGVTISLHTGDVVYFKGSINKGEQDSIANFKMTGKIAAHGSIESMGEMQDLCYEDLFAGCTALVTAPELPAKILSFGCYTGMFSGCTSLVTAPELPATTLAGECYASMFSGCTSLVTAPELPATTLAGACYARMFKDCSLLEEITCNAIDGIGDQTTDWVAGVSPSGTFNRNPAATWEIAYNDSAVPVGWNVAESAKPV